MKEKEKSFIIVCYDITDDKRRNKVANILEDYGERVQYSVFECYLDKKNFEIMKKRVLSEMNIESDKVSFYFLCNNCSKKREYIGVHEILEEPKVFIV